MSALEHLKNNFPYGSTEYSAKSQTQSLSVSHEGFKDVIKRLFKRKEQDVEVKPTPIAISNLEWAEENLLNGKVNQLNLRTTGSVTLGPQVAPFFHRGSKQITDIEAEVFKDLNLYMGLYKRYERELKRNGEKLGQIKREADDFLDKDNYPEGLEAFTELMLRWEGLITPINQKFRDPNVDFLGYGRFSFLDRKGVFIDGNTPLERISINEVTVPVVPLETVKGLTEYLTRSYTFQDQLYEMIDEVGVSIDLSDPPFRGYYGDVLKRHPNLKCLYAHPVFEDVSHNLVEEILRRLGVLDQAVVSYIRQLAV